MIISMLWSARCILSFFDIDLITDIDSVSLNSDKMRDIFLLLITDIFVHHEM